MVDVAEAPALTAAGRLAHRCADIAGAAALSVVLHGSLSAGGFRPGRSDIDLLAVVDGGLADAQAAALEDLVRMADLGNAAGIDLDVVTAAAVRAPIRAPALEVHVSRHDRPYAENEVQRRVAAAPDLLVELSVARAHGRTLAGATPRELIAPIPADWIVDRGRYWLTTWRSRTTDARHAAFMVLTACRIWRFAVQRVHCSKTVAAQWALDRDPSLTVVRQALQQHEHGPTGVVDEQGIAGLLDIVLHETAPTQ